MGDQLDMFAVLSPREAEPEEQPVPPMPKGGEYLDELIANEEPLIFMVGGNPHGRFIRTHSSDDQGHHWCGGSGPPIDYALAKEKLRAAHYYHHSNHVYAHKVGRLDSFLKAHVWRRNG